MTISGRKYPHPGFICDSSTTRENLGIVHSFQRVELIGDFVVELCVPLVSDRSDDGKVSLYSGEN